MAAEQPSGGSERVYRIERDGGYPCGWDATESGAIRMAEETESHDPSHGPHKVREVPESKVHEPGLEAYRIVFTVGEER